MPSQLRVTIYKCARNISAVTVAARFMRVSCCKNLQRFTAFQLLPGWSLTPPRRLCTNAGVSGNVREIGKGFSVSE